MQLYTTDFITGKNIETIGMVTGGATTTKHLGQDFGAGLRKIVGGEVKAYTRMLDDTEAVATLNMVEDAKQMGADAIIGIRYSIASIEGSSKILAFGTAVKFV
jgi:uncharacterized protein YbjQ (UPF0145 family)